MDTHTSHLGEAGIVYYESFDQFPEKDILFHRLEPKLKDRYLYRFPRVKIPRFEEFGLGVISKMEWDLNRYLKGFNGLFENLFEFNDFSFFQDLQGILENLGVSFKDIFIEDVLAYEMLRINLGFKNYAGIERMGRFLDYPPLFNITHDPNFFPNARDISYVLTRIPAEALFEFFQLLVKKCVDYGIIIPRILIWDGQFIRSNCNNNKKLKLVFTQFLFFFFSVVITMILSGRSVF